MHVYNTWRGVKHLSKTTLNAIKGTRVLTCSARCVDLVWAAPLPFANQALRPHWLRSAVAPNVVKRAAVWALRIKLESINRWTNCEKQPSTLQPREAALVEFVPRKSVCSAKGEEPQKLRIQPMSVVYWCWLGGNLSGNLHQETKRHKRMS